MQGGKKRAEKEGERKEEKIKPSLSKEKSLELDFRVGKIEVEKNERRN